MVNKETPQNNIRDLKNRDKNKKEAVPRNRGMVEGKTGVKEEVEELREK